MARHQLLFLPVMYSSSFGFDIQVETDVKEMSSVSPPKQNGPTERLLAYRIKKRETALATSQSKLSFLTGDLLSSKPQP